MRRPGAVARLIVRCRRTGIALAVAVATGSAALPAFSDTQFDAGWQAYQRGDFLAAFNEWQPLAMQGDARAQFNIGVMYDEGKGLHQDRSKAIALVDQSR